MANLGCLLVYTFGNFFASVLVAAHTVNNLDIDHEQQSYYRLAAQHKYNERYESD